MGKKSTQKKRKYKIKVKSQNKNTNTNRIVIKIDNSQKRKKASTRKRREPEQQETQPVVQQTYRFFNDIGNYTQEIERRNNAIMASQGQRLGTTAPTPPATPVIAPLTPRPAPPAPLTPRPAPPLTPRPAPPLVPILPVVPIVALQTSKLGTAPPRPPTLLTDIVNASKLRASKKTIKTDDVDDKPKKPEPLSGGLLSEIMEASKERTKRVRKGEARKAEIPSRPIIRGSLSLQDELRDAMILRSKRMRSPEMRREIDEEEIPTKHKQGKPLDVSAIVTKAEKSKDGVSYITKRLSKVKKPETVETYRQALELYSTGSLTGGGGEVGDI